MEKRNEEKPARDWSMHEQVKRVHGRTTTWYITCDGRS